MPLFRFHRGSLADSLQTTILVKNKKELRQAVKQHISEVYYMNSPDDFELEISPYPSEGNNFDSRIGWFTYMVALTITCPDNANVKSIYASPIGFLSEPFKE